MPYYRANQSVAEVAAGLGFSEAVVKQRLRRGRKKLEARVAELVERALAATGPGAG